MSDIQHPSDGPQEKRVYPWYDSGWLGRYSKAKDIIQKVRPEALPAFVDAFKVFHTQPDFRVKLLDRVFADQTIEDIRRAAASMRPTDLELHEAHMFRRFVVHNNSFVTELQHSIVPLVSEAVGEAVEVSYNFFSFYRAMGICPVHMDAPNAKWTLDLCINQSGPWPIYFSDVRPWSESESGAWSADQWEDQIKQSPSLQFAPYTLQPGQAVLFSGSSQWHYRDAMPPTGGRQFCDLLFFHYIPKGSSELVRPKNWARIFSIPELNQVS